MGAIALPLGYYLHTFDVVTSTMDEARRLAEQGAAHKTLVMADRQTKGRGRRGRPWISAPGNLHLSLILRPGGTLASSCTAFSFMLCLALGHSVRKLIPSYTPVLYKWPNDLVVCNAKIGGVLLEVETKPGSDKVEWLIGGVGLNVTSAPANVPFLATSLRERGVVCLPKDLLRSFCFEFHALFTLWRAQGFPALRALWLQNAYGLGAPLAVQGAHQTIKGIFIDLDLDGSLLLKTSSGEKKKILTGDIMMFTPQEASGQ